MHVHAIMTALCGAAQPVHAPATCLVVCSSVTSAGFAGFAQPALVNGAAGLVTVPEGRPVAVMGFTITRGKIVEINILADPARLSQLDVALLND
jgi:hypothetical protein